MINRWDKSKPPRGPFTLNRDCPQAQGLVAWWPMAGAGVGYVPDFAGSYHASPGTRAGGMTLGDAGQPAMALVAASNQYLAVATTPVAAVPLSMTAWGRADGSTQTVLFACGSAGFDPHTNFFRIVLVSGKVRANCGTFTSAAQANAITTASYTSGAWQLFGATFASTNNRTVYLNGGNAVNDTTSITPTQVNTRVRLGIAITTAEGLLQPFNGDFGECGLWNVALSADMHARLYNPGTRFELWYPLRSRKWISIAASAPSITALSAISITATSAQPRISYS